MAINCYDFEAPVEVCVDGPVGAGDTATMRIFVAEPTSVFGAFMSVSSSPVATVPGWDGSTVEFDGFTGATTGGGCDVVSSKLTVTLTGTDEVEVTIEIIVNNCSENPQSIYNDCDGSPGPHTFTDTRIITMTGASCSE